MNSKEGLKRFAGGVFVAASLSLSAGACAPKQGIELTPQRLPSVTAATGESKPSQNVQEWGSLSALERIKKLELKDYPKDTNFDPASQLVKATSEFFCGQIPCVVKASDLQEKVHLLENDEYLQAIERTLGKGFRNQEEVLSEGVVVPIPSSVKRPDRQIFVNAAKAGQDTKLLKSLLFLGYLQVNQSDENISIEPFTFQGASGRRLTINRLSQLILMGVDNSNRVATQDGAARAMTAYAMSIVSEQTFLTGVNKDQSVNDAALFLKQLMNLADISDRDFLNYYVGQRPIADFLKRLGSINPSSKQAFVDGRNLFAVIALKGNGAIPDNNNLRRLIEGIIGRPLVGKSV